MKLSVSNGNYDVLESNSVILFTPNSELSLHINATSDFSFTIILSFMDADKQEMKKETRDEKLPTHKDNISNYRSSSIEKATDSELFRVSGFSLKTRLHSGTIYVYKRNFS